MAPGKPLEARLELRVGLQQRLVLEVHVLDRGLRALVGVVELLERLVVVLGRQQLLALDAERLRDEQGLLRDLGVEREDRVQLVGRQEVPEAHLAADDATSGWSATSRFSTSGFMRRSTRPMRCIRRTGFQWMS